MKYSFIIPTFNSKKWIEQSLKSVLAQTFTDFDVIIIDSGSTDDTTAWITALGDKRIRIYPTDVRLNIAENWQRITSIPRGEFMTIMGHDDILYPNYLETIDSLIKKFPTAALYQTHFNFIDAKGAFIRKCLPMDTTVMPADFLKHVLKNEIEITATGFMVRSNHYDSIGGISPYPNLLYADTELWLKLILDSYLAVAPETCFEFRFHIDNTSKSSGQLRLDAFGRKIDFFKSLKDKLPEYKLIIEKYGEQFLKSYAIGSCHKLIYLEKSNRGNVTMDNISNSAKECAKKIIPDVKFAPEKFPEIYVAKLIDSNFILRSLFLFFKGLQKRTF